LKINVRKVLNGGSERNVVAASTSVTTTHVVIRRAYSKRGIGLSRPAMEEGDRRHG
jgi:hypothetical protein